VARAQLRLGYSRRLLWFVASIAEQVIVIVVQAVLLHGVTWRFHFFVRGGRGYIVNLII
jgi:hypothetical protein